MRRDGRFKVFSFSDGGNSLVWVLVKREKLGEGRL